MINRMLKHLLRVLFLMSGAAGVLIVRDWIRARRLAKKGDVERWREMLDARHGMNPQEPNYWGDASEPDDIKRWRKIVEERLVTVEQRQRSERRSNGKRRLAYVALGLAAIGGVAGAAAFRSAIPFGSASSWSAATGGDPNATQGLWFNSNGHAVAHADSADWALDKLNYNVLGFGCYGDGVHDDTTCAQNAINAATAANGGTVYFPPGTYNITGLVMADGVELVGTVTRGYDNGAAQSKTLIVMTASGVAIDTPVGGVGEASIRGITLAGPNSSATAGKGIYVRGHSEHFQIRNVQIHGFADECLRIDTGGNADVIEDVYAYNCVLNQTRAAFIGAVDIDGNDHYISRLEATAGIAGQTHVTSPNLYCDAVVVRMTAGFIADSVGEESDIGWNVLGIMNRFSNVRADQNFGHGFYIDGVRNAFASSTALDNSQDTDNTYDGFYLTSNSQQETLASCVGTKRVSAIANWQRYGFNDQSTTTDVTLKNTIVAPTGTDRTALLNVINTEWIQGSGTNKISANFNYLNTKTDTFALENLSPSDAVNTQQISPCQRLTGTAWSTGSSASQLVSFWLCTQPVTGASVTGSLYLYAQINGGPLTQVGRFGSDGTWYVSGFMLPQNDKTSDIGAAGQAWRQSFVYRPITTEQTIADASSITIQPSNGDFVRVNLGATSITAVTYNTGTNGEESTVCVAQDATGGRSIASTWTNVRFSGGTYTVSPGANKIDCMKFKYDSTATAWLQIGPND